MLKNSDGMMETIQPEAVLVRGRYLPHSYVQEPQQRIKSIAKSHKSTIPREASR